MKTFEKYMNNHVLVHKLKKIFPFISKTLMLLILFGLSFVFLYPYFYMIATSFKSYGDIINVTVKWLPREATINNYLISMEAMRVGASLKEILFGVSSLKNSIFLTTLTTIGHILSCSFIGYGFARYNFPFKKFLFAIAVLTIVMPVQTIIIPLYITYAKYGMLDTFLPFVIPSFLGYGLKGGLFIFLFRQYFMRLPKSLEEAAAIDGSGPIKTFFKIAFPSAGPTVLVCLILSMVWHWNDYYEPSLYLTSDKNLLLPQMLPAMYNLIKSLETSSNEFIMQLKFKYHNGVVMAGTAIATLPLFIAYTILQRKFMEGIERSGLVE